MRQYGESTNAFYLRFSIFYNIFCMRKVENHVTSSEKPKGLGDGQGGAVAEAGADGDVGMCGRAEGEKGSYFVGFYDG